MNQSFSRNLVQSALSFALLTSLVGCGGAPTTSQSPAGLPASPTNPTSPSVKQTSAAPTPGATSSATASASPSATATPSGSPSASATPSEDDESATPAPSGTPAASGSPDAHSGSGKVVTSKTGLKYEVVAEGKGDVAAKGTVVSVHYTGTLENGTKFDSSLDRNQPIEFPLGQGMVIPGWEEGIEGMKVGEKRKLIIPYNLAYGEAGRAPVIPPKANLLFDVELVAVKKK